MQICAPRGSGVRSPPDPPTVTASGLGLPSFVLSEPHTLAFVPPPSLLGEQDVMGDEKEELRKWDQGG